jgi:hypothetical protein
LSNSETHEATKFGDSICPICISIFKCVFIRIQPTRALTNIGEGYHLGAPNFRSFLSSIISFPLIVPSSLQLYQYLDNLAKSHRTSMDWKGPIVSGFHPLDFYRLPIQRCITYYHCLSFHRCKQSGLVRVVLVQQGFHQTPILKCTIMT